MSVNHERRDMDNKMMRIIESHETVLRNQAEIERALTHQHDCLEALKYEVGAMAEIVREVGELLAGLKGIITINKWLAVIIGFFVSVWQGSKAVWAFLMGRA